MNDDPTRKMVNNPFRAFEEWLDWLTSHDGRIFRALKGDSGSDSDIACLLPTSCSQRIVTVGDLRDLVQAGKEWSAARSK